MNRPDFGKRYSYISSILTVAILLSSASVGLIIFPTQASAASLTIASAIEYNDAADSDAGDIELVFSNGVEQADGSGGPLAIGKNITLYLNGNNITERYRVQRITHNGSRYILTSGKDVAPNGSLTISIDKVSSRTGGSTSIDNVSVAVTAESYKIDAGSDNELWTIKAAPVALNFTSGGDTTYEITEDGNPFRGPFSLEENSSVAVFETGDVDTSFQYNVTIDINGDGFGDQVAGKIHFNSLGMRISSSSSRLLVNEEIVATADANFIGRLVEFGLVNASGNVIAKESAQLDSSGQATVAFDPLGDGNSGNYTVHATDINTGITKESQTIEVLEVARATLMQAIEYDDGTDSDDGDIELVFNAPVSRETQPGKPLEVGPNFKVFLNGRNVTDQFSVDRVTSNKSVYLMSSSYKVHASDSLSISVEDVYEGDGRFKGVDKEPVTVTSSSVEVESGSNAVTNIFRGEVLALNFTSGANITYSIDREGSSIVGPTTPQGNGTVETYRSSRSDRLGPIHNISIDSDGDGKVDSIGAQINFRDLGLEIIPTSTLSKNGLNLSARISANVGNRRVEISRLPTRYTLNSTGELTLEFGTWDEGTYTFSVRDVMTGISASAQTGVQERSGSWEVVSAVEYDDNADSNAGDIEIVFEAPSRQAANPSSNLRVGSNITVFSDGRNITDSYSVARVTNNSKRYILVGTSDVHPSSKLSFSIDNTTSHGSSFGSLRNHTVAVSGTSVTVNIENPPKVTSYKGSPLILNFTNGSGTTFEVIEGGDHLKVRRLSGDSTTYWLDTVNVDTTKKYNITVDTSGDGFGDTRGASIEFRNLAVNVSTSDDQINTTENLSVAITASAGRRDIEVRATGPYGIIEQTTLDTAGQVSVEFKFPRGGSYQIVAEDSETGISDADSVSANINRTTATLIETQTETSTEQSPPVTVEPGQPGFGPLIAIVALLAGISLALRRRG